MYHLPLIVAFSWIVYGAYWMLSARSVKKDRERQRKWWDSFAIRLVLIFLIALVPWHRFLATTIGSMFLPANTLAVSITGFILSECGIAFAIWARWHLGRNWSSGPALKEGHELVTSGPYAFVRHPIYTGLLTALLGTSILCGIQWILVLLFIATAFIVRMPREESLMMQQFPNEYPEYSQRTRKLVPFVW